MHFITTILTLILSCFILNTPFQGYGAITVVPPPADVRIGMTQGPDILLFKESQGLLSSAVSIDLKLSQVPVGAYAWAGYTKNNPGTLSAGTPYKSYYLHYDPTTPGPASGTHTFDNDILGVILSSNFTTWSINLLNLSRPIVGNNPGTTYPILNNGLETGDLQGGGTNDLFTISADRKTLTILSFNINGSNIDQARVITALPEPSTYALMAGVGLILVALGRKRRNNQT